METSGGMNRARLEPVAARRETLEAMRLVRTRRNAEAPARCFANGSNPCGSERCRWGEEGRQSVKGVDV
jgi:hypothetical protein